ncbi:Gfo/Idh/MocA family protein [Amycolatopsis sp. CA-230715]|uniref:Gfo/Idh/MocA family protein n=1 Tax=Amycolatopsis sp. CA-230715 TaxID=2745196 RepID=UPI001C02A771|nr:Gfo/Idh/MocA family oxidoreductase [Amycolatopsis sp. CA-230715]QWF80221.1 Inositol 2-dehydrogenase/D-chiro-inositol 3-dehydrogenase [Amycolatopsis sp. CA-230715]
MTHRIALVGTGSMGSLHARVLSQNDRVSLARVIDPREEAGRAVADRFDTRWSPEIGDLSDVDAVVLASATEVHHQLALEVLGQDKPLLVEKPVCNTLEASEEVVGLAAKKDIPLMCGLLERYNPAVMTARALVNEPVHLMARRHGPYAPRIKTGVAWDLLVHDVDIAIQFFGGSTPSRVTSGAGYFHPSSVEGAEDTIETVLSFPSGLATVSASRLGQRKVRSLVVSELDRLIEIDLLRRDVTIYRHVSHDSASPDGLGYRQQTVIEIPELVSAREPLATQLDRFVDLLEGKVDAAEERDSIIPSHRVVSDVLDQANAKV